MDKFCRICLRVCENYINLFENIILLNKIKAICAIQIVEHKEYPSKICEDCVKNVNFCYNFRKVIVNNNKDIKERLDTLKKTNYVSKERSKKKQEQEEIIQEGIPEEIIIKTEFEYLEDNSDPSEENCSKDRPYKIINGERVYFCEECNISYKSRFEYYSHKRKQHIARGVCNICGLTLRIDNLKKHVRMHSDTEKKCTECGKVLKNSESLRTHLLVHRGLVFTCEICGKSSRLKSEHTRHIKQHLDPEIRKTKCTLCGKKVRKMQTHMFSHTGERPYICIYCKKGFVSPYSLKVHTRMHTNERPYSCNFCENSYPQKVSLTTHLKSKHGVIT